MSDFRLKGSLQPVQKASGEPFVAPRRSNAMMKTVIATNIPMVKNPPNPGNQPPDTNIAIHGSVSLISGVLIMRLPVKVMGISMAVAMTETVRSPVTPMGARRKGENKTGKQEQEHHGKELLHGNLLSIVVILINGKGGAKPLKTQITY